MRERPVLERREMKMTIEFACIYCDGNGRCPNGGLCIPCEGSGTETVLHAVLREVLAVAESTDDAMDITAELRDIVHRAIEGRTTQRPTSPPDSTAFDLFMSIANKHPTWSTADVNAEMEALSRPLPHEQGCKCDACHYARIDAEEPR